MAFMKERALKKLVAVAVGEDINWLRPPFLQRVYPLYRPNQRTATFLQLIRLQSPQFVMISQTGRLITGLLQQQVYYSSLTATSSHATGWEMTIGCVSIFKTIILMERMSIQRAVCVEVAAIWRYLQVDRPLQALLSNRHLNLQIAWNHRVRRANQ